MINDHDDADDEEDYESYSTTTYLYANESRFTASGSITCIIIIIIPIIIIIIIIIVKFEDAIPPLGQLASLIGTICNFD